MMTKVLGSPITWVVALAVALFAWHKLDKGSAIREAVVGYVADTELAAAKAQNAALQSRLAAAQAASTVFRQGIQERDAEIIDYEKRITTYEAENSVPDECRVSDQLLGLLRSK